MLKKTKALFFIIFIFIAGCKTETNNPVVAKVDGIEILKDEFVKEFTLNPQYRNNSTLENAMLQHLDKMVEQVHFAKAAKEARFDTIQVVNEHIEYVKQRELLKLLYQKEVLDKVPVTEEEAWDQYKMQNLDVAARHLFSKSKNEIDNLYTRLQNGESFELLASQIFRDSTLAANGGYMGFIKISEFDPFLVDSIYNMKMGEISKPLKSRYGYHIFKIEDFKQSVFMSKDYFERNKETFVDAVRNRRSVYESSSYVKNVMTGKSVNFKAKVLQKFLRITRNNVKQRSGQMAMLYPKVSDRELWMIKTEAEALMDSVLVQYEGNEWTVATVIEKLKQMPPLQRPEVTQDNILLKQIIDLVRDEYLVLEAYKQKMDQSEKFKISLASHARSILAGEFKKSIQASVIKNENPELWEQRRNILSKTKKHSSIVIDTLALNYGIPPTELKKRKPLVKVVLQQQYVW